MSGKARCCRVCGKIIVRNKKNAPARRAWRTAFVRADDSAFALVCRKVNKYKFFLSDNFSVPKEVFFPVAWNLFRAPSRSRPARCRSPPSRRRRNKEHFREVTIIPYRQKTHRYNFRYNKGNYKLCSPNADIVRQTPR